MERGKGKRKKLSNKEIHDIIQYYLLFYSNLQQLYVEINNHVTIEFINLILLSPNNATNELILQAKQGVHLNGHLISEIIKNNKFIKY